MKYSNFRVFSFLLLSTSFFALKSCNPPNKPLIKVTYSDELGSSGFDGRLLVLISKDTLKEPRFQINDSDNSAVVVGNDVKEWMPGTTEVFSSETLAYPIEKLGDLDDGDYYVQALLNKYETASNFTLVVTNSSKSSMYTLLVSFIKLGLVVCGVCRSNGFILSI